MMTAPGVDAIICSNPYGSYTGEAKALCIDNKIGLFTLRSFMGAIRKDGEDFLNYLLREESSRRLNFVKSLINKTSVPSRFQVYVFGSYLRRDLYNDIDLILVYPVRSAQSLISSTVESINQVFDKRSLQLDMTVCSEAEYRRMKFEDDHRSRIK